VVSQPRASASAAAAPWQAVAQAGQAISGVGKQIAVHQKQKQVLKDRMEKENSAAQIAQYSTELDEKLRVAGVEGKKLSSTGASDSWKEVDSFYKNIELDITGWAQGLDLTDDARSKLMEKFEREKLIADSKFYGTGGFVDQAKINFDISVWTEQQLAAERGDGWINPETNEWQDADTRWQIAADKRVELDPRYTRQDMVEERAVLGSKQDYFKFQGEMQGVQTLAVEGILSPNEAMTKYTEIIKNAKESGMDINHESQTVTVAQARINSLARSENKNAADAQKKAYKAVLENKFEYADLEALQATMPENTVQALTSSWVAKKAPTDEDVMDAVNEMERFQNGEITYSKMVKSFGDAGDSMSIILLHSSQQILDAVVEKDGQLAAYDTWTGRDKVFAVDEEFKSVLSAIGRYSLTSEPDSVAKNVKGWFVSYNKWKEDPKDKTFDEWYKDTFVEAAVRSMAVPTTEDREAILNKYFEAK